MCDFTIATLLYHMSLSLPAAVNHSVKFLLSESDIQASMRQTLSKRPCHDG